MKIAVSGAVSTGKTTLAQALADGLDLKFIAENMEPLIASRRGAREDPEAFAAAVVECLERKRVLENESAHFVVDRCPLDLINFWQARMLPRMCAGYDIYKLCERYMSTYDFVILTPLVRESPDNSGPTKTRDPWLQFKGSAMITGLAHHFLEPSKIVQFPRDMVASEARLDFVLKTILSRKNEVGGEQETGDQET